MLNKLPLQEMLLNQIQIPTRLLTSYTSLGLNEKDVMVILQIQRFLLENNDFPTPYELAESLTVDETECANILRKLIQKDLLAIEQRENEEHKISEAYSLAPLLVKLYTDKPSKEKTEGTIFILFEQEFGRPLSPFEIETINAWLDEDQLAPSLIKAGLRESVLMGKLNFKYIDRILRDWKKKGIQSVEDARNESKKFHSAQKNPPQQYAEKRDTSFYYNWLEGED
ncbi:DnaD domain-containing protein [Virgibacillus sp. YIM 98842]|jgi:DNA replication protein|uniref:DnaD domain-containing protein n=1 Tax=Virgibacillus sp. YIM 98842 TaxID=2663533 RepID=UPI0013DBA0C3|nr:DnaD domain-containing protein [Virgibacillus sp. YIM 98842]